MDFFISRNSADREWAEWIAGELEAAGYTTVIQDWDFRPGGNFVLEMHQASKDCERTLIVLSQNYLDAEYTQPEWAAAFARDPQGKERMLVPVRVRECSPDGLLGPIIYVDLVGHDDEAQVREILLKGVQAGRAKREGRFPGAPKPKSAFPGTPVFHVPLARNSFFTGRQDVLQELHQRLQSEGSAALSQVQAISGLGGIGKTQTALEYAYRHRDEYQAVLWAKAESEEILTSAFAEIAGVLDLPLKDAQEQALAVAAVKRWLGEHSNWLLVLDNADRPELVKGFLPTDHKGHVLVTSRADVFDFLGIGQPFRMRKMPPDDAHRFLYERTGRPRAERQEDQTVRDLAEELGFLPLALEQAAAYVARVGCTFQTYLQSLRKRGLELLERQGPVTGDYPESVRTTWSMNIEQVARQSEASVELLKLSAFLASDEIPLELLAKGAQEIGPAFAALAPEQERLSIEEILQPLSQHSLIQREPGSDFYSIHRMIQAVVREAMDEEEARLFANRTVLTVNEAFPDTEFETWGFCERLTPHAQACRELVETFLLETAEAGLLLNQFGVYLYYRGRYRTAQPAYERALAIREKALGSQHQHVANSLNNLANLYHSQGDHQRALPLYERALTIREALGHEHPHVATSLNNLALLHLDLGDYSSAFALHERALAIREKALGPKHLDVANSLNTLASLHNFMGDYNRALPLIERALAIREKALGPEHPDVATSLSNLGMLCKFQANYSRALPLLERALAIREKSLGAEHPDVATSLTNLGMLFKALGDSSRAVLLCERALVIQEKLLDPKHPDVATSLHNLAGLYSDQGDFKRGLSLHRRALAIRETALGPEHPDVATTLNNLALLYKSQGDSNRALPLYERAVAILEKALPSHPNFATCLENCASLLEGMGRQREAMEMKDRAKKIRDEHARKNPKTST